MSYIHGGTLDDFWNDPDFNPYKAYIAGGFFAFVCVNYLTKFTVPQHMQHTLTSRQVKTYGYLTVSCFPIPRYSINYGAGEKCRRLVKTCFNAKRDFCSGENDM